MGIEVSPSKKKLIERRMEAQEKRWAARSGPVTARKLTAEELAALAPRKRPERA